MIYDEYEILNIFRMVELVSWSIDRESVCVKSGFSEFEDWVPPKEYRRRKRVDNFIDEFLQGLQLLI
jgi:hypothetical protein